MLDKCVHTTTIFKERLSHFVRTWYKLGKKTTFSKFAVVWKFKPWQYRMRIYLNKFK